MYEVPDCCLANSACAVSVLVLCCAIPPHPLPFQSLSALSYHKAAVDQQGFHRQPSYISMGEKMTATPLFVIFFPKRPPPVSQSWLMEPTSWFWNKCV